MDTAGCGACMERMRQWGDATQHALYPREVLDAGAGAGSYRTSR
jgi:hypothetical protein